jgi:hypothetical protein
VSDDFWEESNRLVDQVYKREVIDADLVRRVLLGVVLGIHWNPKLQSQALIDIEPLVPEALLGEALVGALQVEDLAGRAQAVIALAPRLSREQALRGLMDGFQPPLAVESVAALGALAARLPAEDAKDWLEGALEQVLAFKNIQEQAIGLGALAMDHPEWIRAHREQLALILWQILSPAPRDRRASLLIRMAESYPAWLALSPAGTAEEIVQAILDACMDWTWE